MKESLGVISPIRKKLRVGSVKNHQTAALKPKNLGHGAY